MANRYWLTTCATFSTDISDFSGGEVRGATNGLTWNPHPTEFYPYGEVKMTGDGDGVGIGYIHFKWTSGDGILTADQWRYLMSFFAGNDPTAIVCAKTRTDRTALDALGVREYAYQWYRVRMHRPTADTVPGFRYRNVEIVFTFATITTDGT